MSLHSSRDMGSSFTSDDLEPSTTRTTTLDADDAHDATAALHAALADPLRPRPQVSLLKPLLNCNEPIETPTEL
jgi:hypothetical protein